jgi:FMN phosphatase YigB (HAD superfamily)
MGISLRNSYMVGDRPADIIAGKAAGCRTIWLNDMKCEYYTIMHRMNVHPDLIFRNLNEAATYLVKKRI